MSETPTNILTTILAHNYDEVSLNICLAASVNDENATELQIMRVTDDVVDEFKKTVKSFVRKTASSLGKGRAAIHAYDPSTSSRTYEIEFVDIQSDYSEGISHQIEALKDISSMDDFAADKAFIKTLRYYVLVVEVEGYEPIYFFRQFTEKKELGRSKRFGLFFRDGQYDEFKDLFFLFDQSIDCVYTQGMMFVFHKQKFQQIFSLEKIINELAAKVLDAIQERDLISGFDEMKKDVARNYMHRHKLASLYGSQHLQKMTVDHFKRQLGRTPKLGEAIVLENDKIVYSSDYTAIIVRFLSGDYYKSEITEEELWAQSKRQI